MTLQAIFDDSGAKGQGPFMAMAGLLGEAELIASLADEWDKHLRAVHPGRISYFKMDEALTLDGEFRHWQEHNRDAKIRQMAKVIDRNDLFEIAVVIDLGAYERVFGPWEAIPGGHSLRHPYLMLAEYVLSTCVTEASNRGVTKPFEIVYDEHKKFRPLFSAAYEHYLAAMQAVEPERAAIMPIQPWFRDDMDFVMIQAADMLAGETRLIPVEDKPAPLKEGLCLKLKESGHFKLIHEHDMRALDLWTRAAINQMREGGA